MSVNVRQAEPYDYPPTAEHGGPQWGGEIPIHCGASGKFVIATMVSLEIVEDEFRPPEVLVTVSCPGCGGHHSFIAEPNDAPGSIE